MKRILLTGGSGFIGTNLLDKLLEQGYQVMNIDKKRVVKESHSIYWRGVDILEYNVLEQEVKKYDPHVIVHLAAVTDLDGKSAEHYIANTIGTENVIKVAKQLSGLEKVIFTSSMYVCKPGYIPKDYDDYRPHTLYGESKVKGELLVKNIDNCNFSWIIVRPTSIWGPWFNIPYIDFFNVIYRKKYFNFGNTCTKTYGYVENSVYQLIKLIENESINKQSFYIGDKPPIQISEWADEISIEMRKGKVRNIPFPFIKLAAITGDVFSKLGIKFPMTSFRLNNMRTDNVFPLDDIYQVVGPPPISRLEGVRRTIQWLVNYKGYQIK